MTATAVIAGLVAGCGSSATTGGGHGGGSTGGLTASAPGVTPSQITVGIVVSQTGVAGPEFAATLPGALARIALQNSEGGVDGRRLVPEVVDEGAAGPLNQGNLAAAQSLVGRGVYGIIMLSPFTAGSAAYLHTQGVPVAGMNVTPEYGEQPYTNMFGATGSTDPHYPATTAIGEFLKAHGATNLGAVGYSVSQSSAAAADGGVASAKAAGLKGTVRIQPGFGGNFLTPDALALKSANVDSVWGTMDENSNFALYRALVQAGLKPKVTLFPTDIGDAIQPENAPDLQGVIFTDQFVPAVIDTPATRAYRAAMGRYQPAAVPVRWSTQMGWLSADVLIKGLQVAGRNPTRAAFITNLRQVTDYTAGGMVTTVDFKHDFGTPNNNLCLYFLQVKGTDAVPLSTQPTCGKPIPNSGYAP